MFCLFFRKSMKCSRKAGMLKVLLLKAKILIRKCLTFHLALSTCDMLREKTRIFAIPWKKKLPSANNFEACESKTCFLIIFVLLLFEAPQASNFSS